MNTKGSKPKKAAIYARFSSDRQHQTSIDRQVYVIEDWAERNEVDIVARYSDPAHSATDIENRPEFLKMYQDALTSNLFDTILVYDYSRLFRNHVQAAQIKEELRYNGIRIISVTQPLEDGPNGRLTENIYDILNSYSSDLNSKTTHDSMAHKARSTCGYLGGKVPLGYKVADDDTLEIVEEEAEIVRLVFQMYLQNYSYKEIADILTQRGYRTKNGGEFKVTSFQSMLEQQKYCGRWTWNISKPKNKRFRTKEGSCKPMEEWIVVENGCPAIVSKETFEAVQEKMKERGDGKPQGHGRNHYMLNTLGSLRCAACGSLMSAGVRTSHGRKYTTYSCPNHRKKGCPTKEINTVELDWFVSSVVTRHLLNEKDLKKVNKELSVLSDRKTMQRLRARQEILKRKARNLCQELAKFSSDTLREQLRSVEQQRKALQEEIDTLKEIKVTVNKNNYKKLKTKLQQFLIEDNSPETRDLLTHMIREILVDNNGVSVELNLE